MERRTTFNWILSTPFWIHGKWFFLSSAVGVVAGLGAIVFQFLSLTVIWGTMGLVAGYWPAETAGEHVRFTKSDNLFVPWKLVVVMGVGGLASGLLVFGFAPEAEGHGTDAVIEAFHHKRGIIRGRIPLIKTVASAITIGTGGSGGREGPIAQIGAGFGSFLATKLKLNARDRRIMLAAGMGAGIGSIFRAPLAAPCSPARFCTAKPTSNRTSSCRRPFRRLSATASIVSRCRRGRSFSPCSASVWAIRCNRRQNFCCTA